MRSPKWMLISSFFLVMACSKEKRFSNRLDGNWTVASIKGSFEPIDSSAGWFSMNVSGDGLAAFSAAKFNGTLQLRLARTFNGITLRDTSVFWIENWEAQGNDSLTMSVTPNNKTFSTIGWKVLENQKTTQIWNNKSGFTIIDSTGDYRFRVEEIKLTKNQ